MCGRYSLTTPEDAMRLLFDLPAAAMVAMATWAQPRFNIAPSQTAPVLRLNAEGAARELVGMTWGLIPAWSRRPRMGGSGQINARSETAAEKPTFRAAYRQRRCLVPADGFYEWQKVEGGKQPYWISRADDAPFVFAGLWETWSAGQTGEIVSFTILTTVAAEVLRPIHHRMPVIVGAENSAAWLDPSRAPRTELFAPEQAPRLKIRAVSDRVNSPGNDDAECLRPVSTAPIQGRLF